MIIQKAILSIIISRLMFHARASCEKIILLDKFGLPSSQIETCLSDVFGIKCKVTVANDAFLALSFLNAASYSVLIVPDNFSDDTFSYLDIEKIVRSSFPEVSLLTMEEEWIGLDVRCKCQFIAKTLNTFRRPETPPHSKSSKVIPRTPTQDYNNDNKLLHFGRPPVILPEVHQQEVKFIRTANSHTSLLCSTRRKVVDTSRAVISEFNGISKNFTISVMVDFAIDDTAATTCDDDSAYDSSMEKFSKGDDSRFDDVEDSNIAIDVDDNDMSNFLSSF